MIKIKYLILLILLEMSGSVLAQNNCGITVDTVKILKDENLDSFLTDLQSHNFQTFTNKKQIPATAQQQLTCLSKDKFSLANPGEAFQCCCTSSQKLPKRKLLFFSVSKDIFLITYLTGGIVEETTILMFKYKDEQIIDLWTGHGATDFKSKDEVVKYIRQNKKTRFGLHGGHVRI